jgi:hypothetical protein
MSASTATAPVTARQIADALAASDGNQSQAAELVGLNRSTFTRRLAANRAEVEEILAAGLAEVEGRLAEITPDAVAIEAGKVRADEVLDALLGPVGDIEWVPDLPVAAEAVEAPQEPAKGTHTHCPDCGHEFTKPQRACRNKAACAKRQAALVGATAGE